MDIISQLNSAIDYIESNLTGDIDYVRIAKEACSSQYHFQRMFSAVADMPLSEYIRRRRLTEAAFELQRGGCKVIDTAVKYGYNSPNSFTRAFKVMTVLRRGYGGTYSPHFNMGGV